MSKLGQALIDALEDAKINGLVTLPREERRSPLSGPQ